MITRQEEHFSGSEDRPERASPNAETKASGASLKRRRGCGMVKDEESPRLIVVQGIYTVSYTHLTLQTSDLV